MTLNEIIPEKVKEFQDRVDRMTVKMGSISKSWIVKCPPIAKFMLWYYERRFLKLVKRFKNGR
jgi:hypothetical protein